MSKIISLELDLENYDQVRRLTKSLLQRLKQIKPAAALREEDFMTLPSVILPICESIYNCDISSIYLNGNLNTDLKYYVYAHCYPERGLDIRNPKHLFLAQRFSPMLKNVPFYIGKGVGDRFLIEERNDSYAKIRKKIKSQNKEVEKVKLICGISEIDAFAYESKLIDILGLISLSQKYGLLVNLDEGKDPLLRRGFYNDAVIKFMKRNGFISQPALPIDPLKTARKKCRSLRIRLEQENPGSYIRTKLDFEETGIISIKVLHDLDDDSVICDNYKQFPVIKQRRNEEILQS